LNIPTKLCSSERIENWVVVDVLHKVDIMLMIVSKHYEIKRKFIIKFFIGWFLQCVDSQYWKRIGFVCFMFFLIVLLILDPFHITTATDKASSDILNRLNAFFYPSSGQEEITVVLIDDSYLNQMSSHWPLPYAQQSKIFRQILQYQPKSLFIDFLYTHNRSDDTNQIQPLYNVFERYKYKVPIFVPVPNQTEFGSSDLFKYVTPVSVQWDGQEHYYPLNSSALPTPASALYNVYCKSADSECNDIDENAEPIAVQWGAKLSNLQSQITNNDHCKSIDNLFTMSFKVVLSEVFWKLGPSWRQNCPYSLTLMAQHLSANDAADQAVLKQAIKGKTVLVGALIQGARDEVFSPVHGLIAGVYLHAMALDNLITYGAGYFRPPPELIGNIDLGDLIDCLFFILVFLWRDRVLSIMNRDGEVEVTKDKLKKVMRLALGLLMALIITVFIFSYLLNYQPINWVAQLILIFTILSIQVRALSPFRKAIQYIKKHTQT
jgi:CHASE2 domain-containing sensor protein